MALGKLIRERRQAKRLSQARLAEMVGVSRQTVGQWEDGVTAPSRKHAPMLSNALGIHLGAVSPVLAPGVIDSGEFLPTVPLMGMDAFVKGQSIPAGAPRVSVDDDLPSDAVALRVIDDSMAPDYRPGDLIVVSRETKPIAQDIVIAEINGGAVLRIFSPRGNDSSGKPVFDLLSTSADYPTITCNSSNGGKVLATVVATWRKARR